MFYSLGSSLGSTMTAFRSRSSIRMGPVWMDLKKSTGTPDALIAVEDDHEVRLQKDRSPILCRHCRQEITKVVHTTAVNGSHQHIFTNPTGITYQIACFSSADGCSVYGVPTYEFTWFAGYAWSIALCANCLLHMGWYYCSEESGFFGLILDNLITKVRLH